MQAIGRHPQRAPDGASVHCECHRAEQSTLDPLVQQRAANFIAYTEAHLVDHVIPHVPVRP